MRVFTAIFMLVPLIIIGCSVKLPLVTQQEPQVQKPSTDPEAVSDIANLETVSDISRKGKHVECLVSSTTGLPMKVIVAREGGVASNGVLPPKLNDPSNRPLFFFFPYFTFAKKQIDGVTYHRIGPTPRLQDVIGWVSAQDVSPWPTNVGLLPRHEPGKRSSPLLVYNKADDVKDVIENGPSSKGLIARTMLNGSNRPFWPWPIVKSERYTSKDGKVHELAQIDFLGEVKQDLAPLAANEQAGQQDQREVARARSTVRQLDLAFVIDCTGSLAPYIEATRDAVRSITKQLQEIIGVRPDLAFALVAYRDHDDKKATYLTKVFKLRSSADSFLQHISDLDAREGGDLPEALFDGVDAALTEINWRQGSHRVVCVIADSSGHEPGDRQNPRNLDRKQIIAEARDRRVKVFGLVTPLSQAANAVERSDKESLWSQLRDITKGTGGEALPLDRADQLVDRMRKIMDTEQVVVAERARIVEAIVHVGAADAKQVATKAGVDIRKVTEVLELLPGAGIDLKKLTPGVPAYSTGWVLIDQPGVPVLERFVYLSRDDVRTLRNGCSKLALVLHRPEKILEVFKLAEEGRVGVFDEFFTGNSNAKADGVTLDVWLAAGHIPCGRQSCLRFTRKQLERMPVDERVRISTRLETEILPSLCNDINDVDLWRVRGVVEYGWVREEHLP